MIFSTDLFSFYLNEVLAGYRICDYFLSIFLDFLYVVLHCLLLLSAAMEKTEDSLFLPHSYVQAAQRIATSSLMSKNFIRAHLDDDHFVRFILIL